MRVEDMSTDESDDYCGYRQNKSAIERRWSGWEWDSEVFVDTEQWDEEDDSVVCLRDPWTDYDRCVWHAETKDKSAVDFRTLRANGPERLDGAYLVDVELDDRFPFARCWLRGANLSEAALREADLSEAYLREADLSKAYLSQAYLSEATLSQANLSGAYLGRAYLSEATLSRANLSGAILRRAYLSEATLWNADLSDATLREVDLSEANLHHADLPNATLTDADLSKANIRDATFWYATLEDTVLTTADCRGTDFRSARLYQAIFRDTRINSTTQFVNQGDGFFGKCTYELSPDEILADDEDEFDYECHPYEAAAWTYRRLQSLHEENALSEHTRDFHIRKEEVQRKNHHRVENYPTWTVATLSKYLTNYGESFKHLFLTWGATILIFGVLYPFAGGFTADSTNKHYSLHITLTPSLGDVLGSLRVLAHSLYFSIITFTTIGYGDLYPTGALSKALVGAESLAGGILIALFVFVLGRRVAR